VASRCCLTSFILLLCLLWSEYLCMDGWSSKATPASCTACHLSPPAWPLPPTPAPFPQALSPQRLLPACLLTFLSRLARLNTRRPFSCPPSSSSEDALRNAGGLLRGISFSSSPACLAAIAIAVYAPGRAYSINAHACAALAWLPTATAQNRRLPRAPAGLTYRWKNACWNATTRT